MSINIFETIGLIVFTLGGTSSIGIILLADNKTTQSSIIISLILTVFGLLVALYGITVRT